MTRDSGGGNAPSEDNARSAPGGASARAAALVDNNLNQLTKLTEPGGYDTTFAYDSLGNRTGISYPNGVALAYTYNAAGQPLTLLAKDSGGEIIDSITYTYVAGGTNTSLIQSAIDQNNNTTNYTYDPLNRLIEAKTINSGGTTTADYQYAYDGAGNRLTQTANGATTNYTYNAANELTVAGAANLGYDGIGQETNNGSLGISYNAEQQTSSVASSAMTFFGSGQTEQTGASGVGLQNSSVGIDAITSLGAAHYLTRTNDGVAVGERTPGGRFYLVTDPRGSVLAVTDSSGITVSTNAYDPYGAILKSTGTGPRDLGYLGSYLDSTTGLQHFGARILDPASGRFTQRDPVAHPGDPTQVNAYAYAGDNPVNNSDLTGDDYYFAMGLETARIIGLALRGGGTGLSELPLPGFILSALKAVAGTVLVQTGDYLYECGSQRLKRKSRQSCGLSVHTVSLPLVGDICIPNGSTTVIWNPRRGRRGTC